MTHAENKLHWCLKKGEKEGRKHRGLRKIPLGAELAADHIRKAEHNLLVMEHLISVNFHDWAVHASFYAHYHCLLAVLHKFGYESRNQECTFAAVECLIEEEKITMEKSDLHSIFAADRHDDLEQADIVGLREKFQYGTETSYEKKKLNELLEQTKSFIEKTKVIMQE